MELMPLEQIIRQYVLLSPSPNAKGWHSTLCKVCNDHGRKGWRGGFKFDGETVAYNCFNCGHVAVYDPNETHILSNEMVKVLHSFGIPEEEWQQVQFSNMSRKTKSKKVKTLLEKIEPNEIELPEQFYPLSSASSSDKWAIIANHYLEFDRCIDPNSYPFMLCDSSPSLKPELKKWVGRVIIPIYKDSKLIYYIGRNLVKTVAKRKKYESPNFPKDRVICGFDKLFIDKDSPLFITEGWFDAYVLDCCATLGNRITDAQAQWFNRSPRKKVYIPDRYGDGDLGAKRALRLGWSVSIPDIGDCKDVNEAVKKYGKLYTFKTINENICEGFEAELRIKTLIS